MPGVLLNSALGMVPDRSVPVRSGETLTVIAPMYNEEFGARRCLASILEQRTQPDQIAISINGGQDDTHAIVCRILREYGYRLVASDDVAGLDASLERWLGGTGAAMVVLLNHRRKTGKSESVNNLFNHRLIASDRVLLVDGDTILHPDFVTEVKDNFYRLYERRVDGRVRHVIEDYALVSGNVSSWLPAEPTGFQRIVSLGRRAEYAFSTLLRKGQASQHGHSAVFGNSRLFTVVGCGFTARRELFPMPHTTRTEDHEFTLDVQNLTPTEVEISPEALDSMGLRIHRDGEDLRPSEYFAEDENILLRTGGNARFVPGAMMLTEDPSTLSGYLNQVERWNGGGLEGALGRIGRKLRPNVAWTVWSAQLENLIGIMLLLVVLPNLVALNIANPSLGMTGKGLLLWLLFDLLVSFMLNVAGFTVQRRARGMSRRHAFFGAIRQSFITLPGYLVIRYLNPFTYVSAALEVVPAWLRSRRRKARAADGTRAVTWERPRGARLSLRTTGVMVSVLAIYPIITGFVVGPSISPVNAAGWSLTHTNRALSLEDFTSPAPLPDQADARTVYCTAGRTGHVEFRFPHYGSNTAYQPLGLWDLLALGRLSPLLPIIEQAAQSYGVRVVDLLKILMNESLFDPLAEGPTGDLGLSQLTGDALTLLAAASRDPRSSIYNPSLVTADSNVFDPVFSACAGAAKLAWAYDQPRVNTPAQAYALYINPVHGFVNGRIGDTWLPLVAQMEALDPSVRRIAAVYAQYESDPSVLGEYERRLVEISHGVASGQLRMFEAYESALQVISDANIDDRDMYRNVLTRLYLPGPVAGN